VDLEATISQKIHLASKAYLILPEACNTQLARPMDHVEHAVGQAGLLEQVGEPE
jgi:hypothetical protein